MRGSDAGSIGTPSQKNEEPTRVAQKTAIESCVDEMPPLASDQEADGLEVSRKQKRKKHRKKTSQEASSTACSTSSPSLTGDTIPPSGEWRSPSGTSMVHPPDAHRETPLGSGERMMETVMEEHQLHFSTGETSQFLSRDANDKVPQSGDANQTSEGLFGRPSTEDSQPSWGQSTLQPQDDPMMTIGFQEEPLVMSMRGSSPEDLAQELAAEGYTRSSPMCRANLWCHEELLNTCVDSGATVSLLSSSAYKRILHTKCVSAIMPTKDVLTGASGKQLKLEGVAFLTFSLDGHVCETRVMVGELHGVDLLLGMDWLSHNEAYIDFGRMLLRFRRDVVVALRTTENVFSRTHNVRYASRDPSSEGLSSVYPGSLDGFVQVRYDQEVQAGHAKQVNCYISGLSNPEDTALFSPLMNLGPGIEIVECLVKPQEALNGAWTIQVAILNCTGSDLAVTKHTLLGRLQAVDQQPASVGNVHGTTSEYAIWDIPSQSLRRPDRYLFSQGDWAVQTKMTGSEFHLVTSEESQQLLCCDVEVKVSGEDVPPSASEESVLVLNTCGAPVLQEAAAVNDTGRDTNVALLLGGNEVLGVSDVSSQGCRCQPERMQSKPQDGKKQMYPCLCSDLLQGISSPLRDQGGSTSTSAAPVLGVVRESDLGKSSTTPTAAKPDLRPDLKDLPEHLRCMMPPEGVLEPEQVEKTIRILNEFQDVFVGPDGKVGYNDEVTHKIETSGEPIKSHPRAKSPREKEYIQQEVLKLLKEGKIEPSKSPWGAPVVLVRKKDGTLRFCIDFRRLNDCTKKDAYPLPRIDECLDCLSGSQWFCTLDLASGYWQVAMDPEDKEKTAFITHSGLYHWIVMPFGLCNAPATFCRLMETVLADIVWSRCLVYLDDIITFGKDFDICLSNLTAVFIRLRSSNLKLKAKKCELFRTEVDYLGHQVSRHGIRPSEKKVRTLHDWKMPQTLTEVRSFVGFCSYYRRFIPGFSDLSAPFVALTKKGVVCNTNTKACRDSFEELKKVLTALPMLYYADPAKEFILDTDASYVAIGACLSQVRELDGEETEVPIAFASKTLSESRRAYCTTKKELYAIVYFMRYWQCYVAMAKHVRIRTDHGSLRWLMNFGKNDRSPGGSMYVRWATEMERFLPWTISSRPGRLHGNADGMSRAVHSYDVKTKNCGIEGCSVCEAVSRENQKCRGEDSDESDDEDPPNDERRSRHPLPENHLYGCHQLRMIRQKARWGVTKSKSFGGYRSTPLATRRWRRVWRARNECSLHEHHWSTRQEGVERPKRVVKNARQRTNRVRTAQRREACEAQRAYIHDLQVENVRLMQEMAAMELASISRSQVSEESSVPDRGTSGDDHQTVDKEELRTLEEPSKKAALLADELPEGSKTSLQGRLRSPEEQVRERCDVGDSGYSTGMTISGDDMSECLEAASESAACGDTEACLQLPLRKLPGRKARDQAKQAIRDAAPRGRRPRKKRQSMERKGRPPDDTPSSADTSAEEIDSPSNPMIPPEPSPDEEATSILETIGWSNADWIRAQDGDVVIARLKKLLKASKEKPSKTQCRRESRVVSQIIHASWHFLRYNSKGILCRRVPRKGMKKGTYVWQRLVPDEFRDVIFRKVHQEACMHMGYSKVYAMIVTRFYWYNMSQDLLRWTRACKSCQQSKRGPGGSRSELKQEIVGAPMERMAMDLQGPFPESQRGNRYILVIQDYFSKWVEIFAIPDKNGKTIATILNDEIFCRYASCCEILSDKGLEFENQHVKQVLDAWGVRKSRTSGYAPWSNGMLERSNRVLKNLLRQNVHSTYNRWDERLPQMRLTMNTIVHSTTGETPYKVWFSRCEEANLPIDLFTGRLPGLRTVPCMLSYVEEQLRTCHEIHEMVRECTGKQAASQARQWRRGGLRIRKYRVGEWVWRFYPPHKADKLNPIVWTGPYQVLDVDDTNHLVKLALPSLGRGGVKKPTWVHTSNVKPVHYDEKGKMIEQPAEDIMDDVLDD